MNAKQHFFSSTFFFTGATVLTAMFGMGGDWALLPMPLFLMLVGGYFEDRARVQSLDLQAAAMLFERPGRTMLPLDFFRGNGLMFYQAGQPVYRCLSDRDNDWQYVGNRDEVEAGDDTICVYPGIIYRRIER